MKVIPKVSKKIPLSHVAVGTTFVHKGNVYIRTALTFLQSGSTIVGVNLRTGALAAINITTEVLPEIYQAVPEE